LNTTLGALLIGAIISTWLYGIASLQTYHYFNNFSNDRLPLRIFVAGLWVVDTFHSICIVHAVYFYAVSNYMNPTALVNGVWSIDVSTVISTLVACACQMFFIARVWVLGRNIFICTVFCILCLVRFALSVVTTWASFNVLPLTRYLKDFTWSIKTGLAVATAGDVLIAAAMVYYLRRSRSSGLGKTNKVILRLLTFTVETCMLTSTMTTVDIICFVTMPSNFIFLGIYFQVSKLYTNAMLTSLNVRRSLRRDLEGSTVFGGSSDVSRSAFPAAKSREAATEPTRKDTTAAVTIRMDTLTSADAPVVDVDASNKQTWLSY